MIKVGVTGVGGPAGVVVTKTLSDENDFYVVGMDADGLSAGFKFSNKKYIIPPANDPRFIERLFKTSLKEELDVLIPTVDEELLIISKNKKKFEEKGVKIAISDYESIITALDKYHLYTKLASSKIPTPKTYLVNEIKLENLNYPLILKPRTGRGSRNITICNNYEELKFLIQKIENLDILIQEYVVGEEFTIDTLSNFDGKPLVAVPRKRIEIKGGVSWKGAIIDNKLVRDTALRSIEVLKVKGPACVQAKLDENGLPKIFDVNPRIGGTTSLTIKAGVNIPYLTVKLLLGMKIVKEELSFRELLLARYFEDAYFDPKDLSVTN